jgi:hypothetical protein
MLQLRVRHEIKIRNGFKPGLFDYTLDLCDVAAGATIPIIGAYFGKDGLSSIMHRCPYEAVR